MSRNILLKPLLLIFISLQFSCQNAQTDNSLPLEKYIKLGVTEPNQQWNSKELKSSLEALVNIKKEDFYSLPRKGSAKSGKVYEKIISPDNRITFNDRQEISYILTNLLQLYEDENLKRRPGYYHEELTGVIKYYVQFSDEMSRRTVAAVDTDSEEIRSLLARNESGYAKMVSGALFYQSDSIALDDKDMIDLSNTFIPSLEHNWKLLSQPSKDEINVEIENILQNHHSEVIRLKYRKFIEQHK